MNHAGKSGANFECYFTKEDFRLVMLDFMKDCNFELSDLQRTNFSPESILKMQHIPKEKAVAWSKVICTMLRYGRRWEFGISCTHHLCTVLFPEYPWMEWLFPNQVKKWYNKEYRMGLIKAIYDYNKMTSHEDFYDRKTYEFIDDFARDIMKVNLNPKDGRKIAFGRIFQFAGSAEEKNLCPWYPWYNAVMEYFDTIREENGELPIEWEIHRFFSCKLSPEENLRVTKQWWKNLKEELGIVTAQDLYDANLQTADFANGVYGKAGQRVAGLFMRKRSNGANCRNPKQSKGFLYFLEETEEDIEFDWYKLHGMRKRNYWKQDFYCRNYLLRLLDHMDLDGPKDLIMVCWDDIVDYYGESFCKMYGKQGIAQRIVELFPEYHLEVTDFLYITKSERYGTRMFQNWFGHENVKPQFKLKAKWPCSQDMKVDNLIKTLNLVIETNGLSHYSPKFYETRYKINHDDWKERAAKRYTRQVECDIIKAGQAILEGYRNLVLPLCKHDPNLPKWNKTFDTKSKRKSQGVSFIKLCELQGITREEIEGALYG